ncbi:MAG: type II secretion system protein [Planctomycetia bacterium]|nr:type II secretion system protein [Planctomycetia bacterium]
MTATNKPRIAPGRGGFTLIELLMVILIIGILASIVMGALHAAQQSGRAAQTRTTISKIHQQLMLQWEAQRTRRVPTYALPSDNARTFAARQLQVRRDLMRADFPDRYEDIFDAPIYPGIPPADAANIQNHVRNSALRQSYERAIARVGTATPANASAECLYLIATYGLNSETEFKVFSFEVGDTDQDGMREFIDGWGRPIQFLRWAPGFIPRLGAVTDLQNDNGTSSQGVFRPERRDSFDPLGVNPVPPGSPPRFGYDLTPLIYSAGLDSEYGLFVPPAGTLAQRRNPYSAYGPMQAGQPLLGATGASVEGGGHQDNITNHQLGVR